MFVPVLCLLLALLWDLTDAAKLLLIAVEGFPGYAYYKYSQHSAFRQFEVPPLLHLILRREKKPEALFPSLRRMGRGATWCILSSRLTPCPTFTPSPQVRFRKDAGVFVALTAGPHEVLPFHAQ